MRNGLQLLRHSLRRYRTLLVSVCFLLAGFQVLLALAGKSLTELNAFGAIQNFIPDFLKQALGESLVSVMSFGGIVSIGYFHVAVVGALVGVAIAVTTETAGEIETRFMDLVLSRPLARHWPVTRSIAVLAAATLSMLLAMRCGTWLGLRLLAPAEVRESALRITRDLAVNLGAEVFCWGAIALAVASISRRRSTASGLASLLALTSYLLDYIARVWSPARWPDRISPFRYYVPLDLILGGGVPATSLVVLLGISAAALVFAYAVFSRRDL
jgi:ABC-2 type transport system permease protein